VGELANRLRALDLAYGRRPTGEEVMPRWAAQNVAIAMTSQTARFGGFVASRSRRVTSLAFCAGSTAAGATPSLVKWALYTVAANGDLTRVGITASDTAMLAAAGSEYIKAMAAPVDLVQGQHYAIGALVVTAATAPTVAGSLINSSGALFAVAPRLSWTVAAQADLAASYAAGSLSQSTSCPYAVALE
jgi:hypothetical protein